MKKYLSIFTSIIISISLISGIGVLAMSDTAKVNPGYSNVLYFGAKANDELDDMGAIKKAMNWKSTIYLPEGEYVINETLDIANMNLVGDGSDKTVIVADFEDKNMPIVKTGRTVSISGITFKYKDGLLTGEETECERIGIYCSGTLSLQRGSRFTDVTVENVGTGLASGFGIFDTDEDVVFSVTFDGVTVKDFSFRGFDWRSETRTGNYFKSVTVSSGKYRADSAVYFVGEESETAIDSMIIKDTIAETPVVFERMNAISAKSILLDNVYALHHPIITWDSSVASIDKLTFDYCDTHYSENPLISVNDAYYIDGSVNTLNGLHIGTLKLNSFNSANVKNIISRAEDSKGDFYLTVDEYIVKNSDFDWDNFPADESGLFILKKGEIATEGSTDERPEKCLCKYYSRYYDTTLGRYVIWNGEEWK